MLKKGETVYMVQMAKGTDNTYDETAEPRTLFITLDRQEAIDFFETLPARKELKEPETDLEGNLKYETPVVARVCSDNADLIRG